MTKKESVREIKSILKAMRSLIADIKASQKEIHSLLAELRVMHEDEIMYLQAMKLILMQQRILDERIEALEWEIEPSDEEVN